MSSLSGKHITLAISGGIAAYKCPHLCRSLVKRGAEVQVLLTRSAKKFVAPVALKSLSGRDIPGDGSDWTCMEHIDIARWTDLVLIAPATADMIARLAAGRSDDLITTIVLATRSPIACCPSMNKQMYENVATQHNIETLKERRFEIWGPDDGEQACGECGPGRMMEPHEIVRRCEQLFQGNLFEKKSEQLRQARLFENKKVVVTAGPTREPIDPVRFLSNKSSGKMGYAVASVAASLGAKVTLVTGPCTEPIRIGEQVNVVRVSTAYEMLDEVMKYAPGSSLFVGCAAVCDYSPIEYKLEKIKSSKEIITLELEKNPDIISTVAALEEHRPFVIGFAAETSRVEENAIEKLKNKRLDLICANDVSATSKGGFDSNCNEVVMLWSNGREPVSGTKVDVARAILQKAAELMGLSNSD